MGKLDWERAHRARKPREVHREEPYRKGPWTHVKRHPVRVWTDEEIAALNAGLRRQQEADRARA